MPVNNMFSWLYVMVVAGNVGFRGGALEKNEFNGLKTYGQYVLPLVDIQEELGPLRTALWHFLPG
ncbi:MAG: hypothetical protein ACE15F_15450 [bacterium]